MRNPLPQPPSTNFHLAGAAPDPYAFVPDGATVLDVGGGSARGRYAVTTSAATRRLRVITLDVAPEPGVQVIGDAHKLPLADASVDCVLCVSVLEYLRAPHVAIAEIERVLKPGGILYLSAPFVFPHHPPHDLFRFSMSGMRVLAERFEELGVGYNRGPASTFCHVLVHFVAVLVSLGSRRVYGLAVDAAKWLFFWIKYLDAVIGRYETASVLHGSAFFLGRKPMRA